MKNSNNKSRPQSFKAETPIRLDDNNIYNPPSPKIGSDIKPEPLKEAQTWRETYFGKIDLSRPFSGAQVRQQSAMDNLTQPPKSTFTPASVPLPLNYFKLSKEKHIQIKKVSIKISINKEIKILFSVILGVFCLTGIILLLIGGIGKVI